MWRETEGDGEGDITRLVAKDADTSDSICLRILILLRFGRLLGLSKLILEYLGL